MVLAQLIGERIYWLFLNQKQTKRWKFFSDSRTPNIEQCVNPDVAEGMSNELK